MATKSVEMQVTECPVCHENYNNPKILPCAHLMCRDCLVSWIKKETLCPICRSAIVEPRDSTSRNCVDKVDSLATDLAMSAIIKNMKILNEKRMCSFHTDIDAASFCLQCNKMMCHICVEVHKSGQITTFHKLENLSTFIRQVLSVSCQELCSFCHGKTAELFCAKHNVFICQLCVLSKHHTCSEVFCLQELYEEYKQSLAEMEAKLNVTILALDQATSQIETLLVKSETSMKSAFTEIDTACNRICNFVEACRRRLKKHLQSVDDRVKADALQHNSSLGARHQRLISHMYLIQRVQHMARGSSFIAMVPMLKNLISKLDLNTSLPEEALQGLKKISLTIVQKARVLLEQELEKISNIGASSASIQDEVATRTNVQDSPNSNLTSCTVSIPSGLLQECDLEACLKNPLLRGSEVHVSERGHNIVFSVNYDYLMKLVCSVQEQITSRTVVKKQEDKIQNQTTHETLKMEINSLEFEAMQHILSHDFKQYFSKVKKVDGKATLSFDNQEAMDKFKEKHNLIRREEVKLTQDELVCLEKSTEFMLENVEAFIQLLPLENKVVIICFDYNAMTKIKHSINVKVGKVKITQRNKRQFDGDVKESDEMVDHQASLTAVSHIDSNSSHSHVKHKDFSTKSGIKVSVYKADITQLTVDVIVNAANRDFNMGEVWLMLFPELQVLD